MEDKLQNPRTEMTEFWTSELSRARGGTRIVRWKVLQPSLRAGVAGNSSAQILSK